MSDVILTEEQKNLIEKNQWDEDAVIAYLESGMGGEELKDFEESYQRLLL